MGKNNNLDLKGMFTMNYDCNYPFISIKGEADENENQKENGKEIDKKINKKRNKQIILKCMSYFLSIYILGLINVIEHPKKII